MRLLSRPSLGEHRRHADAHLLGETAHEVHVLHGLPRGPLDEVVDHADDDAPTRQPVVEDVDDAVVGATHVARLRHGAVVQDRDEVLIVVDGLERLLELRRVHAVLRLHVDGLEDTARHGHEVRREVDDGRGRRAGGLEGAIEALLDLRRVAVGGDAVGVNAVGNLAEERALLGGTPRPGGAAFRVDDDIIRLDEALLEQRDERQLRGRGVAARVRHEARLGDVPAGHLGEAVDGLLLELHGDVRLTVPLLVGVNVGEAEVRRQVDDLDVFRQLLDGLLRLGVRQAREDNVHVVVVHVVHGDEVRQRLLRRELREHRRERLPGLAVRRQRRDLHERVLQQDAHELRAGVARRA
mmetsp:Transcript_45096/g.141231  ORF Transcript_45096/g.141231 Transcript_45096/m.141231 type:complete len:353 (+) Transcript_45096:196-1254(+)